MYIRAFYGTGTPSGAEDTKVGKIHNSPALRVKC